MPSHKLVKVAPPPRTTFIASMGVPFKALIRREVSQSIAKLSSVERTFRSSLLFNQFVQLEEYKRAKSLCLFISLPKDEPSTIDMIEHCLTSNKTVFVPSIVSSTGRNRQLMIMRRLPATSINGIDENWPRDRFDIPIPPVIGCEGGADDDELPLHGTVDLFIVPGRAFTLKGDRLGRGGGFYDRYLKWYGEWTGSKATRFIGLAFKEQIFPSLPMEPHDVKLDRVLIA